MESKEMSGVVIGAADGEGVEDTAGSEAMLVDSVKGAAVTRVKSDAEGRMTVGRIG